MRIHVVEAFVLEGKMPHVALVNLRKATHAFPRQLDVSRSQIYPHGDCSIFCELQQISTCPASEFENPFARVCLEFCRLAKPWICRVALLLAQV